MRKLLYIFTLVAGICSCTSIDCPMNSHVYAYYGFYVYGDTPVSLVDTLTVRLAMNGGDSILLNRKTEAHSVQVPVSFLNAVDTLMLTLDRVNGGNLTDHVWMEKTNDKHFESVECGPNYFHQILSVKHTHNFIDSIAINKKDVNYDPTEEHLFIYLKR